MNLARLDEWLHTRPAPTGVRGRAAPNLGMAVAPLPRFPWDPRAVSDPRLVAEELFQLDEHGMSGSSLLLENSSFPPHPNSNACFSLESPRERHATGGDSVRRREKSQRLRGAIAATE